MMDIGEEFQKLRQQLEMNLSFLGEQSSVDTNKFWIVDEFYGSKIQYVYISKNYKNQIKEIVSELIFAINLYPDWRIILEFYEETDVKIRGFAIGKERIECFFDAE